MHSITESLSFAFNAVNPKSSAVEMRNFIISDGQIRATNGKVAVGCPIDIDLNCAPQADLLMNSARVSKDVISLNLTPTGKLSVKSGKFRSLVPCLEVEACASMHMKPSGTVADVDGESLVAAFKELAPFVATDGARPWTNGILLKGKSALATNNVCLVEYWIGLDFPFVANVPLEAVDLVIKQNLPPAKILMDGHTITFFYDDGRWIKTVLFEDDWPPVLDQLMNVESSPKKVPEDLFAGLKVINKFAEFDHVYFKDGALRSDSHENVGAEYQLDGLNDDGIYKLSALQLLDGVADTIDFSRYPDNAIFFGGKIRGVLVSIRP